MHNNKVELLGYYGGDKRHALAAWASTFFELELEMPQDINTRVDYVVEYILNNSKRMRSLKDLILFLGQHKHTSPFRFSTLDFATTTDIATHIHFLKHKVALQAENAESARYKELKEDKFYIPKDWSHLKVEKTVYFKEGEDEECLLFQGENIGKNFGDYWEDVLVLYTELGNKLYHQALKELTPTLGKKRAKESARFFKTYNSQLNSQKIFSFDGFTQIYFKRNLDSPSQQEIGYVIEEMLEQIKGIEGNPFEYSLQAFGL